MNPETFGVSDVRVAFPDYARNFYNDAFSSTMRRYKLLLACERANVPSREIYEASGSVAALEQLAAQYGLLRGAT